MTFKKTLNFYLQIDSRIAPDEGRPWISSIIKKIHGLRLVKIRISVTHCSTMYRMWDDPDLGCEYNWV